MEPLNAQQQMAMLIAMHVRNEMEDFHVAHLTDEQMRELNPIIRNAIYDALTLMKRSNQGESRARRLLGWLSQMVPSYWEAPELSPEVAKKEPEVKKGRRRK